MSNEIMSEEMKSQSTTMFSARRYSNEERIKRDEEELAELVAQQKNEAQENAQETQSEPEGAEEKTFKKRYGDLRRHSQQREQELESRINALKQQLESSTKQEIRLPKSDEDIEAWASKYPDVAAIVETIAIKKAREQAASLEDRVKVIDEMRASATKEKAEAELIRLHPDFDKIRDSDDFHEWAEEQPKWVQDALYENQDDARSAARAIDLYKSDRNIKAQKGYSDKDAARYVDSKSSRSKPAASESGKMLKESQVAKMSPQEYEKRSDEIMDAIRTGKFIYDISGSAR